MAAPNPPLDAARLDVVPSRLWGQAEAVRTFARNILQSFAPLLFGYISALFGGPHAAAAASANPHLEAIAGRGLEYAFIIMLVPLLAAGVLLLLTRRTYLVDVATADVSERATPTRKGRRLVPSRRPVSGPPKGETPPAHSERVALLDHPFLTPSGEMRTFSRNVVYLKDPTPKTIAPMTTQQIPTMSRITPTVLMLKPLVVAVTA